MDFRVYSQTQFQMRLELNRYEKILCVLVKPASIYFYKKWKKSDAKK